MIICAHLDSLNTGLGSKATSNHIHDDRYYTEAEIDGMLGGKHYACYQWIGWGVTMIGTAIAYHIGKGSYVVKVQGDIISRSTANDKFAWGLNLTAIRSYAGIPHTSNCRGQWSAYRNGALMQEAMQYGTAFGVRDSGSGYTYLVPSRYYDASTSDAGWWGCEEDIAQPGTFWDVTLILW